MAVGIRVVIGGLDETGVGEGGMITIDFGVAVGLTGWVGEGVRAGVGVTAAEPGVAVAMTITRGVAVGVTPPAAVGNGCGVRLNCQLLLADVDAVLSPTGDTPSVLAMTPIPRPPARIASPSPATTTQRRASTITVAGYLLAFCLAPPVFGLTAR